MQNITAIMCTFIKHSQNYLVKIDHMQWLVYIENRVLKIIFYQYYIIIEIHFRLVWIPSHCLRDTHFVYLVFSRYITLLMMLVFSFLHIRYYRDKLGLLKACFWVNRFLIFPMSIDQFPFMIFHVYRQISIHVNKLILKRSFWSVRVYKNHIKIESSCI